MSIPSFSIGQTMSVFMVSQSLSTSTQTYQNGVFLEQSVNANNNKGFYLFPGGGSSFAINNGTTYGTDPSGYNPIPVNTISIDAGINPDPSNTSYITYYKNGTASSSTTTLSSTTNTIDTLYLNNRLQNAANIAEIMIFNIALTASQRREVEGYLAVKWGISSLLPTTHPYYTGNYSIGQLQYIMSSAFSTSLNYQLCVYSGSMIQVSSSYGTNFTTIPSSFVTASNAFSAVSSSGQYMVVCIINTLTSTGPVYYSSDFGATWLQIQSTLLSGTWTGCSMSSDGSYINLTTGSTVYTINPNISINSVAIGYQAGQQNQGQYSIAIGNGAGQINQPANSIVMNATSSSLNGIATVSNGCFIAPIASSTNSSSTSLSFLGYGSDNQIVQLSAMLDSNDGLGLLNQCKGFYIGSKTDNYTISGYSYSHYSISWASVSGFINTDVSPKCFISGWAGMSLITGGVPRLVMDASGYVGIGSTEPINRTGWFSTNGPCLQIVNNQSWTGDQFNIISNSSDTAISLTNNYSTITPYNWRLGVGSSISGGGNGNFYIYNGTSIPFTIGQNGNVGIGTTSANYKLDVNGNTRINGSLYFAAPYGDPAGNITCRTIPSGQGDANQRSELIIFQGNDGSNGAGPDTITLRAPCIRLQTYNDANVADINNNAGSNDRLVIDQNGTINISDSIIQPCIATNSYGSISVSGGGIDGNWSGYDIGNWFTFMAANSNVCGIHSRSRSWMILLQDNYVSIPKPLSIGSTENPADYGAYVYIPYGDPNGKFWFLGHYLASFGVPNHNAWGTWQVSLYARQVILTDNFFGTISDIRTKKNIKPCGSMLSIINQIEIVSFDFIDPRNMSDDCGVIAQQLISVFPNAVSKTNGFIPCFLVKKKVITLIKLIIW